MILAAVVVAVACLVVGFVAGVYAERSRRLPLLFREDHWAIGIYVGDSPLRLGPAPSARNPVLTARQVTDRHVRARFVGDPFMVQDGSVWYMFFEVLDGRTYKGKIALASSPDALAWVYHRVVLEEPYHLSYPYVFDWEGAYYMVPESAGVAAVRLYRAVEFPFVWSFDRVLLHGPYVDPSVFRHADTWWLFVGERGSHRVRLFWTPDLGGPWTEHPRSPLVTGDPRLGRPGGRVLVVDGRIIRYAQDEDGGYGNRLRAFEITELSPTRYEERAAATEPVLRGSGTGWNADGMHHIDPHPLDGRRWIACVDGNRRRLAFRLAW